MALPRLSSILYLTRGTPLYRRSVAPNLVHQVLTGLAEGLSLEATARLIELEPETVAQWPALAANHFEALPAYLSHNLKLEQVQYRPPRNHHWRRSFIGRARFQSTTFSRN